jgi:hypothetical protein
LVVPLALMLVLVLDGAVLLGVAALLGVPELLGVEALLGAPELLGVPLLLGVPEPLGALTRVSVLAAVPPWGFTDWLAVVPAGLSPLPLPALLPVFPLAGAFTFWLAFVFWLVFALVFTFVLVLVGVKVLLYVGEDCGKVPQPAVAQTAAAIKVKYFLFMAFLLEDRLPPDVQVACPSHAHGNK